MVYMKYRCYQKKFEEICDNGGKTFYWQGCQFMVLAEPVYYGNAVNLKDGTFKRFNYADKVSVIDD